MFRGNHPTRVDEKGRLKLPAEFKRRVDELYGPQFYITSKDGKRAEIYPLKEWEKIEEKLAEDPFHEPGEEEVSGRDELLRPDGGDGRAGPVAGSADCCGRRRRLTGDVVVFGVQTYLEVVNHDDVQGRA